MNSFDAYEYVGVIIPGALPTLASILLFPELTSLINTEGVALGEFGIFIMVCFVIGHVVQMVGGLVDRAQDILGIGKADLAINNKDEWFGELQWSRFTEMASGAHSSINRDNYDQVVRSVYAIVRAEGRADRVDAFNRNFGMCRGLVAGSLVTIGLLVFTNGIGALYHAFILFIFLTLPLFIRMRRFSRLFISELVAQATSIHGR